MEKKSVSIVVPVYNAEKSIYECIDSILNQSYKNFEVVCIDDGSTDDSAEIIKNFVKKDKRIKYYYQKNAGASSARNKGIEIAKYEYLIFVDIDDYIDKFCLEKNVNIIQKESMVCFDNMEIWNNYSEKREVFNHNNKNIEKKEMIESVINGNAGLICGKMVDLRLVKKYGIKFQENLKMCEDELFFLEVILKTKYFFYLKESLYYYDRRNENSLSLRYKEDMYEIQDQIFKKIEKLLEGYIKEKEIKKILQVKKEKLMYMAIFNELNGLNYKNILNRIKKIKRLAENINVIYLIIRFKILSPIKKNIGHWNSIIFENLKEKFTTRG